MKKTLLILALTIITHTVFAQISITTDNSNPDASAMLDIKSTNKGMLIPRLTSVQRTAIVSPATGLLVFDNTTGSFWFYSGSTWDELISDAKAANTIADADNDTKIQVEESADDDIIRFDMGGTEYFRMVNGRLEVFNTGGSLFIGRWAGLNDNLSGNQNVFVGQDAGRANTNGGFNSVLGIQAFYSNTLGDLNTAMGYKSLYSNTDGIKNTGIGHGALFLNTTGTLNTALGYGADVSANNLTNATAIGADALVGASNSLVLGNNANVGIGTSTPGSKLHVEGTIEVDQKIKANDAGGLEFATDEGTPRLRIIDNGNVGIGTTNPQSKLHVEGTIEVDQKIQANDSGGLEFATEEGTTRMKIIDDGKVGIGTTNPTAKLEVNGSFILGQDGTKIKSIITGGYVVDLPNIGGNDSYFQNFFISGVTGNSVVIATCIQDLPGGLVIANAAPNGTDNIRIKWRNTSGNSQNAGGMNYKFTIINW